jgi:hypothetical protein
MKVLSLRHILARASLALMLASGAGLASAQDLFVALATKGNVQPLLAIPAPGNGWEHSAAAPVPGTQWNRVRRPAGIEATDPAIRAEPAAAVGKTGRFPLGENESVPLVDATGKPSAARLAISVNIASFANDKPRSEPTFHSKSKQAAPAGLMDGAWRVYLEGNGLVFTVSGLVPGKAYDLYVYGAGNDPRSTDNPAGDGQGARFTLAVANTLGKDAGSAETSGGFYSSLYTFNPESGVITLSPVGTTWAKLGAVVDSDGVIRFSTGRNSRRSQYINGFQLVEVRS